MDAGQDVAEVYAYLLFFNPTSQIKTNNLIPKIFHWFNICVCYTWYSEIYM